jgi:hypothetical protein
MERVETTREQTVQAQGSDGRRPRRRIAKEVLQRGQRLRNRVGVIIGVSLGVVALLTVLE